MDLPTDDHLDFEEEECGGNPNMQYDHGGAIPALTEEEMIGDDDEYDDLYNDVNVGDGFLQMQRSESQMPSTPGNNDFQTSKNSETRADALDSQVTNDAQVAITDQFPVQAICQPPMQTVERDMCPDIEQISQSRNLEGSAYPESAGVPHKTPLDHAENEIGVPSLPFPNTGSSRGAQQVLPSNVMNPNSNIGMNNRPVDDEYMIRPSAENGSTIVSVGELHWWTTDAELESVLIQYGRVKEIKFFDERASGKSKGYCQVEFYDPSAASSCKEGMNGHIFNGRPCVVTYSTPQTTRQMGVSYLNKNQAQTQAQLQSRNLLHESAGGRGYGLNYSGGDSGRNLGRGGWGRANQLNNRGPGPGPGPMRGRGGMGNRNMIGNAPNPGFGAPPGLMHPQGMMGPGFDLAFMGRGVGGYGGFAAPAFSGMFPPFQGVGVSPHVNPAFFGRGISPNGIGIMGNAGGAWNDGTVGGWGGEEHGRESSYAGEDNASEYGHAEASHEKVVRSSGASREKERNSDRDWSSNPEKRHREEDDGERYSKDSRYRNRHKDRDLGYNDDWDKGPSSRSRSRSAVVSEDDHHTSRSRDADYGKRKHMASE